MDIVLKMSTAAGMATTALEHHNHLTRHPPAENMPIFIDFALK